MLLILTVFIGLIFPTNEFGDKVEKAKIKSVIEAYVKSGDMQSTKLADQSMHKEFTQYLDFMKKGIGRSELALYKSMISEKKIGGEKRSHSIKMIDVVDGIAFAKVVIKSPSLVFYDYVTLMKDKDTDWQIVSITLTVRANK